MKSVLKDSYRHYTVCIACIYKIGQIKLREYRNIERETLGIVQGVQTVYPVPDVVSDCKVSEEVDY